MLPSWPRQCLVVVALLFTSALHAAELPTSSLTIVTGEGKQLSFTVELANTPAEREMGLMFRSSLAPDAGMLFDFKEPQIVAFWMKNTLIPLDMLFIDKTGRIVRIVERAVPGSLTPISSGEPVLAVLEVNSGTASRLEIHTGDIVDHPIFQR
ncbi:MAG TPA: DUF192 domain-containing protein [Alphaproteobacteria bacterium]|nr:DUF192 domain-containing protein [Alphaproteobacteria bacterium]